MDENKTWKDGIGSDFDYSHSHNREISQKKNGIAQHDTMNVDDYFVIEQEEWMCEWKRT